MPLLTGVDPFDPRPANRREYKPGAGGALGAASPLPYLILANITSGGSETLDQISDTPLGDEADAIAPLGASATRGIRFRWVGPPTQTQTFGKGALTAGSTEDDMTAVIGQLEAALKKGHGYYIVTGKTATGVPTTTDNGLGELEAEIKR